LKREASSTINGAIICVNGQSGHESEIKKHCIYKTMSNMVTYKNTYSNVSYLTFTTQYNKNKDCVPKARLND